MDRDIPKVPFPVRSNSEWCQFGEVYGKERGNVGKDRPRELSPTRLPSGDVQQLLRETRSTYRACHLMESLVILNSVIRRKLGITKKGWEEVQFSSVVF